MNEASRKHGAFDWRWPATGERAAARAAVEHERTRAAASVSSWETEGGASRRRRALANVRAERARAHRPPLTER